MPQIASSFLSIEHSLTVTEEINHRSTMENQEKPLSVDEEYDLWKSNVPLMYDFVSETRLTWPSLTVQWLPTPVQESDGGFIKQELIIGTHTSGEEGNLSLIHI